jgi:hypothetical protein
MQVNINRAIKTISDVGFYQPLYEGIVNSFQADATEIKIKFNTEDNYVIGYSIEDNGEGFTNENIESYLELWSEHKIEKGALGSGRILCLKVFDNIIIKSQTKDFGSNKGHYVEMDFNRNFKANTIKDINPTEKPSTNSSTITEYKNINDEYKVSSTYENEKEPFNLDKIQENIFIKLLPMFIRFNEDKNIFSIIINEKTWLNSNNLQEQFKEHKFQQKIFRIKKDLSINNKDDNLKDIQFFKFTLLYRITKDKNQSLEQFYGASDRYIKSFPKGIRLEKLDTEHSGIFCLTSSYFDTRVKDSRSDFLITFNQSNPTKDNPVTFPEINKKLSNILNNILKKQFPKVEDEFNNRKKDAIDDYPHLARYVNKIDNLTISKIDILKQAEEAYRKNGKDARNKVIKFTNEIKESSKFDSEKFKRITRDFTESGQEQLAQYIGYRQMIIELLFNVHECNMNKTKESYNEDYIHELIMPQKKIKQDNNHVITENNFWLFDDKFMSFSYTASDTEVHKIIESLSLEIDDDTMDYFANDRPDLLMLYSNKYDEHKDVVIIELKKINIGSYDRSKAVDQLNTYASIVRDNIPKVNDIFVYTVFDFDTKLEKILLNRSFQPKAFSKDGHNLTSFYMYNPNTKAHVYALSFYHLISDADLRNRLFLKILKDEITVDDI